MIQQSIVFDIRQSLDKHWMWTIYGQSFVLLLHEETILKAWKNSGHTLFVHGQSLDCIFCGPRPIARPWAIGQILDKHGTLTNSSQI